MAINIEDHDAVPEHVKLDEEEAEDILEKFDAEREDLPQIERTDAALKPMDVEEGDIIQINRESPSAGETTYYRVVVER